MIDIRKRAERMRRKRLEIRVLRQLVFSERRLAALADKELAKILTICTQLVNERTGKGKTKTGTKAKDTKKK